MANRRRANGKVGASDGDDSLPPDWEIRYPRTGGQDAYYYNTKTDESTWTRPRAPTSGRSLPTKNGGAQTSSRHSPELMGLPWRLRDGVWIGIAVAALSS